MYNTYLVFWCFIEVGLTRFRREEAVKVFRDMLLYGSIKPNKVTFFATLTACSYAQMV